MYFSTTSFAVAGRNEGVSLCLFAATANFTVYLIFLIEGNLRLEDTVSLVIEISFPNLMNFLVSFHLDDYKLYPSKFDDGAGFEGTPRAGNTFEVIFPVDFIEMMVAGGFFFFNFRLELKYSSILSFIN